MDYCYNDCVRQCVNARIENNCGFQTANCCNNCNNCNNNCNNCCNNCNNTTLANVFEDYSSCRRNTDCSD